MPVPMDMPERAIVRAVNVERTAHGLPDLRGSRTLARLAARHSRDQLRHRQLTHDSSDGTPFGRRIAKSGTFRVAGEVLAFRSGGSASHARTIVRMWMRSPMHRDQLMNPSYRLLGVGRVRGGLLGRRGALVTADLAAR